MYIYTCIYIYIYIYIYIHNQKYIYICNLVNTYVNKAYVCRNKLPIKENCKHYCTKRDVRCMMQRSAGRRRRAEQANSARYPFSQSPRPIQLIERLVYIYSTFGGG